MGFFQAKLTGRRSMFALFAIAALAQPASAKWVAAWGSAQQLVEPGNEAPAAAFTGATLRQVVRITLAGQAVRIRFSNAFGSEPLTIDGAHVARAVAAGSARIVAGSDRALTFDRRPSVTIPAGADYLSDPVALDVAALSSVAVSVMLAAAPKQQTGHPGSRTRSFYQPGDQLAATDMSAARPIEHWYLLSGVEVDASPRAAAIITLGDSITDGRGSTTDGNDRWPDLLADRLQDSPKTRALSVVNVGIGGNRLLLDGIGPNALARFDRDVLARPGVKAVIVLEGVNDLGTLTRERAATRDEHRALIGRMIAGYRQIIARAHAHGVRVIGVTIMPYMGMDYYHPDAANEADRQAVNAWIRTSGAFDAVADLDAATRDPARPDRLLPAYDSGDHIHPSPAGFKAMAAAIDLKALFR
ncbi:SGNH/GDSL hydrolase family protein [Sphingomonas sp.]|uniref:SGNH/GDSL hydrolase family protein n=1 Tax=Sphingomonas sp. TaxID=28214 RepID=UPI003B3B2B13